MTRSRLDSAPPLREQAVTPLYAASRQGAIRPSAITAALRSLDGGDCFAAAELFDEMEEKDFHLAAVMQTRVTGVTGMEMSIAPANDSADGQKMATAVSQFFWNIPDVYATLSDLLNTGLGYGMGLAEIFWNVRDGSVVVDKLHVRDPRWLRYDHATDPERLIDFPRWITTDNPHGEELDRSRFLYFTPLAGRHHPVRAGLYRGLAWLWLFSSYTVKDWLAFNELFGQPMRVGKYGSNAGSDEKQALRDAVKRLGADAAAIIDQESAIEFIYAQGGTDAPYRTALNYFNAEKSKRILGQTLTTESGSSGSYAQAKVHDGVRRSLLVADARKLEEALNRDLIRPFIDYNYGPQESYPALVIQTDLAPEVGGILDNAKKMQELGFDISERWLREQTGIEAPDNLLADERKKNENK